MIILPAPVHLTRALAAEARRRTNMAELAAVGWGLAAVLAVIVSLEAAVDGSLMWVVHGLGAVLCVVVVVYCLRIRKYSRAEAAAHEQNAAAMEAGLR